MERNTAQRSNRRSNEHIYLQLKDTVPIVAITRIGCDFEPSGFSHMNSMLDIVANEGTNLRLTKQASDISAEVNRYRPEFEPKLCICLFGIPLGPIELENGDCHHTYLHVKKDAESGKTHLNVCVPLLLVPRHGHQKGELKRPYAVCCASLHV